MPKDQGTQRTKKEKQVMFLQVFEILGVSINAHHIVLF